MSFLFDGSIWDGLSIIGLALFSPPALLLTVIVLLIHSGNPKGKSNTKFNLMLIAGGFYVLSVFFGIIGMAGELHRRNLGDDKFDQEIWHQQEQLYHPKPGRYGDIRCIRGRMYKDLHKNYLKFLMNKEEIEDLLGHSTIKRKYGGLYMLSECFQYNLGSCYTGGNPLIVFCNIPFTNLYRYYLANEDDSGQEILEDEKEYNERSKEIDKRNEFYRKLRKQQEAENK